jgi:hypothetical protein
VIWVALYLAVTLAALKIISTATSRMMPPVKDATQARNRRIGEALVALGWPIVAVRWVWVFARTVLTGGPGR